jgi:hypothetical protein
MKNKTKIISVVLFLSAFIIIISFGGQKAEWKGKIEKEKGIKVIKNPKEPLYGEIEFELEEDLSIGREGDDNYMFHGRVSLAVDNQDNIYALDGRNYRIQKYDKNGQYLQTIGRKGQGPGEFELPFSFFVDGQNNIYVYDRRKLKVFNNRGEFSKSVSLRTLIYDFCMSPEGSIFASSELRDAEGSKQTVIEIDPGGELIERIAEFPFVDLVVRKSGSVTYSFGVSRHVYIPQLYISNIDETSFCYAHSSENRIFILDKNGNILHIFQKEESPLSVSRKEKNFILDQMKKRFQERGRSLPAGVLEEVQFPANRPFFDHIMADDKQRLYVRRMKSVLDTSEGYEFDIFSKEGIYLYKTKLPFTPLVIKNGFVYKVEYNEETGEIKIKRLKVVNWNQIKEGM